MSEKLQHKKTEHFRYSGSICGNVSHWRNTVI